MMRSANSVMGHHRRWIDRCAAETSPRDDGRTREAVLGCLLLLLVALLPAHCRAQATEGAVAAEAAGSERAEDDQDAAAVDSSAVPSPAALPQDGVALDGMEAGRDDRPSPVGQRVFGRREALLASLTIFVLAVFLGFEVITKVPPTLHTPLMSGSNAISGITLVGAVLMAGSNSIWAALLGMLAVALAMVNVVGGFLVTDRMLGMFRRK